MYLRKYQVHPNKTRMTKNDYDYDDNNDDQNHELIFTF